MVLERRRRDHADDVVPLRQLAQLEPRVLAVVDPRLAGHVGRGLSHRRERPRSHRRARPRRRGPSTSQHAVPCPPSPDGTSSRGSSFGQRSKARRAARVEAAAGRDVGGVGQLAGEDLAARLARIRRRHDRQQRLRVRVARVADHLLRRPRLDDPPEVHDGDPVAQRPRQAEVVRDEDQAEVVLPPQPHQHVQHLRAHRHVERRHGLVADQRLGPEHHRRGDHDPLALAAGQLVRVAVPVARGRCQPGALERRDGARHALRAARHAVDRERLRDQRRRPSGAGSATGTGPGRSSGRAGAPRGYRPSRAAVPSTRISPDVGGWRPSSVRPSVDLPQPDSPTMPSTSPRRHSRSTPSMARTTRPPERWTGKCTFRSRASNSGVVTGGVTALMSSPPAGHGA